MRQQTATATYNRTWKVTIKDLKLKTIDQTETYLCMTHQFLKKNLDFKIKKTFKIKKLTFVTKNENQNKIKN